MSLQPEEARQEKVTRFSISCESYIWYLFSKIAVSVRLHYNVEADNQGPNYKFKAKIILMIEV